MLSFHSSTISGTPSYHKCFCLVLSTKLQLHPTPCHNCPPTSGLSTLLSQTKYPMSVLASWPKCWQFSLLTIVYVWLKSKNQPFWRGLTWITINFEICWFCELERDGNLCTIEHNWHKLSAFQSVGV